MLLMCKTLSFKSLFQGHWELCENNTGILSSFVRFGLVRQSCLTDEPLESVVPFTLLSQGWITGPIRHLAILYKTYRTGMGSTMWTLLLSHHER